MTLHSKTRVRDYFVMKTATSTSIGALRGRAFTHDGSNLNDNYNNNNNKSPGGSESPSVHRTCRADRKKTCSRTTKPDLRTPSCYTNAERVRYPSLTYHPAPQPFIPWYHNTLIILVVGRLAHERGINRARARYLLYVSAHVREIGQFV